VASRSRELILPLCSGETPPGVLHPAPEPSAPGEGDLIAGFQYLKGPIGKMGRDFLAGPVVIGQGVMALNCKRVDVD